jgi:Tol biopolymer transport system component
VVVSGATNVLSTDTAASVAYDWMPDGRFLLCTNSLATQISLLPVSPDGAGSIGKLQTVLDTPYNKFGLRVSPNGQWVALTTNESVGFDVYVASFPSFAEKHKVSTGGGLHPVWRKDGKELFLPTINGMVMAAEVKTGAKLEVGIVTIHNLPRFHSHDILQCVSHVAV